MFNPSREQVRQFFSGAWLKHRQASVLTPLESMAVNWVSDHPEYHGVLEDPDSVNADFPIEAGQTNPFLHLSMHLAISEQLSIDQPPGIKAAHDQLLAKRDRHAAAHEIMECLGEVVWEAQRLGTPFSNEAYLDLIRRRISRN